MPNAPLGSWRNPPLAYVVAEVRFSPFYKLAQHVPDFQAAVRSKFPRTREGHGFRVEITNMQPPEPEKFWRFFTENERIAIDLSTRVISIHATEYENFESFSGWMAHVFSAAEQNIPDLFVEQLGLRYIDYILPAEGETGFEYVVESIRGFTPPNASAASEAYWIASYPLEQGSINLRVVPKFPPGIAQPPSFGPIEELAPSNMQRQALERAQRKELLGCIDTDRIMPVKSKFEADKIQQLFSKMHADVSETFKTVISEKAKALWF